MATVAKLFETMEYGPAPESDAPALEWIKQHDNGRFGHFINGRWVPPPGGQYFERIAPARKRVLARVARGGKADVDAAGAAANAAAPAWAGLPPHARARYLYALAREVQRHSRLLAVLESLDNGKPIRETRDLDIPLVARHFYHHAGWAQLRDTEFPGYVPVGVVGQIIPWNFPLLMVSWKVAPALAAGNTVILKPAEFTPLTALCFAGIAAEAGLPPGVFNVVTGDGATGKALVEHPDVQKIAFTGSTEVGRIIRKATAGSGKKLTLELGGKSPFIVFEDADLDSVVEGVVDAIVAHVQLERIRDLVEKGVEEGAKMWQPSWACPTEGYFYPPTLFTDVSPAATIAQIEIFGPVLVSMTFRTPKEAVELANNTPYGLAASVWSENINLALDVAPKLKAGVVWVNSTNLFDAAAGFGGYRESGFGREGGREGMWEYLKAEWESHPPRGTAPGSAAPERVRSADPGPAARGDQILPPIDRTYKLFIGGKQARPDQGYSRKILGADGRVLGEVAEGNRKDVRNAVEAAHAAEGWGRSSGHMRAQILYFIAENLATRADEFAARLGRQEVDASIARLFTYAAWADKWDGAVHHTPIRGVTLAMNEPVGVLGIAAPDEFPLLGFVSLVAPALAVGNTVIVVPSETQPIAATEFYSVIETSDVPDGVLNVVTGSKDGWAKVLAEHDDVDGMWYFGKAAGCEAVRLAVAANMKRTWATARGRDWLDPQHGEGREFLRRPSEGKNIWIPYGEAE